jgi:hypothetical protein
MNFEEMLREIYRRLFEEPQILPISLTSNIVRCLDYDMDRITFTNIVKPQIKLAKVIPIRDINESV